MIPTAAITSRIAGLILVLAATSFAAADTADTLRLDATRSRPLFSPTRRPPPPAVAPAIQPAALVLPGPPAASAPTLQLSGVVMGGKPVAIIKLPSDPKARNVTLGTLIDGWTVIGILPREIQLRHADRTVIIYLPGR